MDTEEFLIKAEEIAMLYPEDELAARFLKKCTNTIQDEDECMQLAGQLLMKFAS